MYGHVIDAYKFVKRRSGTRVERRERPQESFQQTLGSLSDLVALAAATDRDIRSIDTVVTDRRDLPTGDRACEAGREECLARVEPTGRANARPATSAIALVP
jgi:GntR family transcriptional regulator